MNKITNIGFKAIDINGVDTLSTYCLEITPITFIPDIPEGFPHRLVWDFGDGSISNAISATKIYPFQGVYTVSLVVYDCETNANISSYVESIEVKNYINFTFNIKFDVEDKDFLLTENGDFILDEYDNKIVIDDVKIKIPCGKIDKPFNITAYYPSYQPPVGVYYDFESSRSKNYWSISNNKFAHLDSCYSLYKKTYNNYIKAYQYDPIDKIDFEVVDIYGRISNGNIVECDKSDIGSVVIGRRGMNTVYIKDDTLINDASIKFKFDKTNMVTDPTSDRSVSYLNNTGITLKYDVVANNDVDKLSITSNGSDGEGLKVASFDISNTKFFNTKIPFVIKIKDSEWFSVKNFEKIPLSSLDISVSGNWVTLTEPLIYNGDILSYDGDQIQYSHRVSTINPTYYTIYSLNDTLSGQNSNGSFRGYIEFSPLSSSILTDVVIQANGVFTNDQSTSYSLSGVSASFNVYKKNRYDIFKKNENFNPTETLKNLRFQETLLDKNVLFEDFLGGILGDEYSTHDAIGVKIYEKIANFTANIQDVDCCEIEFLDSHGEYVGYNDFGGDGKYNYPEKIKRLINLGSIDKSKLLGGKNKFKENLDIRGHTSKDVYGVNIGQEIDPITYNVDINTPIVALEKFSNQYILLNTYQPYFQDINTNTNYPSNSSYPLSTYNSEWGWPLVLPTVFDFSDIEKYYLFFEYNHQYDNTSIGGIIDFENPKTTISSDDITSEVFKHMNMDTLYQTLKLMNDQ